MVSVASHPRGGNALECCRESRTRGAGILAAKPIHRDHPEGHYRGTPRADQLIVYVVRTAKGQEVLTPKEFEDKYGWKNDPDKVRLTDR